MVTDLQIKVLAEDENAPDQRQLNSRECNLISIVGLAFSSKGCSNISSNCFAVVRPGLSIPRLDQSTCALLGGRHADRLVLRCEFKSRVLSSLGGERD